MGRNFEPGQCAVSADAAVGDHQVAEPGKRYQATARQGSWVQVTDPTTSETGWVYARYVAAADAPPNR